MHAMKVRMVRLRIEKRDDGAWAGFLRAVGLCNLCLYPGAELISLRVGLGGDLSEMEVVL
jgi:hypothetical protein